MRLLSSLLVVVLLFGAVLSFHPGSPPSHSKGLSLPLYSSGRWILDSDGEPVTYVGANWPGAADVMLPEGLQYQSIAHIVGKLVEIKMNAVRLTYATQLVDQIYDNHGRDVTIQDAFVNALGVENGTKILQQVLYHNPQFTPRTTRTQVYDAIATELAKNNIYLHLDNHISHAQWCCGNDGSGWFNDTYFDVDKWIRGHEYMAAHGKKHWKTFASVGLRNELRPATDPTIAYPYTFEVWAKYMTQAASAIHAVNPDVLIFFGGVDYDTSLYPIVFGQPLSATTTATFDVTAYDYYHKMVFELHTYGWNTVTDCPSYWSGLYYDGFAALNTSDNTVVNRLPVVLTEWGHSQEDGAGVYNSVYHTCLHANTAAYKIGWTLWTFSGSYYIKNGVQDVEDLWGLLDKEWTDYRGVNSLAAMQAMIDDTFSSTVDSGVHFTQRQIRAFKNYRA